MKASGLLLLVVVCTVVACAAGDFFGTTKHEKVLMKDVTALTLRKGEMTTGRRSSPVPQLQCVGYCPYEPDVVQCTVTGYNAMEPQWKCDAEFEGDYKMGRIEVVCEGYDYPDDPYILKGSCGLEYSVERRSGSRYHGSAGYGQDREASSSGSSLAWLFIIGIVLWVGYSMFTRPAATGYGGGGAPYGGGGGAPYGGGGAPYGGGGGGGGGYGYGPGCGGTPGAGLGGAGGGPGFWSGMATGGLMGYLFNRRPYAPTNYGYGYGGGYGAPSYRSGYSGGFGSSSSSSGFGGGSSTSSGYGGTRRR